MVYNKDGMVWSTLVVYKGKTCRTRTDSNALVIPTDRIAPLLGHSPVDAVDVGVERLVPLQGLRNVVPIDPQHFGRRKLCSFVGAICGHIVTDLFLPWTGPVASGGFEARETVSNLHN